MITYLPTRNASIPNRLGIPEHLPRIYNLLNGKELSVRVSTIVQTVGLHSSQARIHMVQIGAERCVRHRTCYCSVEFVNEIEGAWWEWISSVRRIAIVLQHP